MTGLWATFARILIHDVILFINTSTTLCNKDHWMGDNNCIGQANEGTLKVSETKKTAIVHKECPFSVMYSIIKKL